MTQNKVIKPDLRLSMDDKIYLAVAYKQVDRLAYVYAFACNKTSHGQYELFGTPEVMTFRRASQGKLYYQTLVQIQEAQKQKRIFAELSKYNTDAVEEFLQHTK